MDKSPFELAVDVARRKRKLQDWALRAAQVTEAKLGSTKECLLIGALLTDIEEETDPIVYEKLEELQKGLKLLLESNQ